jgi:hypothetical protein
LGIHLNLGAYTLVSTGEFGVPDEDMEEPKRTEMAFVRQWESMLPCLPTRYRTKEPTTPGIVLERLPGWLADAAGSKRGCTYLMVQVILQLLIALNIGFFNANAWAPTSTGGLTQACMVGVLEWLRVGSYGRLK